MTNDATTTESAARLSEAASQAPAPAPGTEVPPSPTASSPTAASPSNTSAVAGTIDAGITPKAAAPAEAPESVIDITHFAAVKLRVAQIKEVAAVEKSNKLYRLQVDLGLLGTRQIVSGIAKFYTPEQLIGRKIIIVANLKPAMLMGHESQGMLLAASTADKSQLSLLMPGEDIPNGSAIS